jgi:hypothetical protein
LSRISRFLTIVGASSLGWVAVCSSAGNAARDAADGGGGTDGQAPRVADAGAGGSAEKSYTRIDDMEGTSGHIEWTPPAGTMSGAWGTNTDSAQYTHIRPIPTFDTADMGIWSYEPVPAPYETFPGITSAHAARLRTTQPLVNTWGAAMGLGFAQPPDAPGGPAPTDPGSIPLVPVDLSAYRGITVWGMAAQNLDTATIVVSFHDRNTFPGGGACVDSDGRTANLFQRLRHHAEPHGYLHPIHGRLRDTRAGS